MLLNKKTFTPQDIKEKTRFNFTNEGYVAKFKGVCQVMSIDFLNLFVVVFQLCPML